MSGELAQVVRFDPAYDCVEVQPCVHGSARCKPGTPHSHGRHSTDMTMLLGDERGWVQFKVFTGWMRDETPERAWGLVMAADLGYHSPRPLYEDQSPIGPCDLLRGDCFYDGSGLNAEEPWRLLRHEGSDSVWEFLAVYWRETFVEREPWVPS